MIGRLFSYDHAAPERTRDAVRSFLVGDAVGQYESVFGKVREEAPKREAVLSTRVTDSAVVTLRDGRARLLVFADQQTTRTGDGSSSHAPAMLAVDAVRRDGRWRIDGLDMFG
ncbi:hypothetical protein BJF79_47810 [Actinomadura sp. CNU-125]|uniref:nuclear transport factor 2 family protein n=1 Tax=Actinomadura sp. CNU-125 TaxID=1904961 RepID=UPI000966801C|nr:nuclear transport factor 2 family protein [Actinomadura sp. CNU-125]OLT19362.1 hypothetical protein BJF79_47810 [Actinomadura sp. CNU-125]